MPAMKAIPVNSPYIANAPILVSATLAALGVWYFNAVDESPALFLGIIAGGLVDLDNRLTGRLRNVFFTLLHFSAASLLVQLTVQQPWLFAALMTTAAFTVTMAGALDVRYRTIAFGTLLVMMYTVLTYLPHIPWYVNPLMIVCGTVLYSLCTLVLHLLLPHRPVQENMARAWRKLGELMMVKAQFFDPDEADYLASKEVPLAMKNTAVINAFNECRSALFYRLRSQHRHPRTMRMLQYYLAAQNLHERISSRHVEYRDFAHRLEHSDLIYRIQRLIVLQAQACANMAESLHNNRDFACDDTLKRAGAGLRNALALHLQQHPHSPNHHALSQLVDNILAISSQLQRLENVKLSDMENGDATRIAGQDLERPGEMWRALISHCTLESAVFRHAVRMALITAASCLLVAGLDLHFGYWILLTALIVCQPNYSATTTRLKQRILGTVLGVLVGALLPYFALSLPSQLAVMVISGTLFFAFRTRRYSFSTFFITVQALAGFSLIGLDAHTALYSRILDTVIGAGLAWVAVSYLWPDWHYLTLGKTGVRALQGDAGYLQQILAQLQQGHADDVNYRVARRLAHERAAALSNTVSDMSIEPQKYGTKLQDGFTLLQLNYALISSISALGAMRSHMAAHRSELANSDFWPLFLAAGAQLVALMQHTDTREPEAFQAALQQTRTALAALQSHEHSQQPGQHLLWQQLQHISDKLPLYFDTLRHSLDQYDEADIAPANGSGSVAA